MNAYYVDYSQYLSRLFPGIKVQKLSVDAGFTCPNRDGKISKGGCIYCDNRSFSPGYTRESESVSEQIRRGREFFAHKYPNMKYLAYFQAYTNTYAPAPKLEALYREALQCEDVVGLIVSTRPDCIGADVMEVLKHLAQETTIIVELGAETSHDLTLDRINRHHKWQDVCDTATRLFHNGIHVGLHLIFGLPGESIDDMLNTVRAAVSLPIDTIKMHQMQVVKDTQLHRLYEDGQADIYPFTVEDYLQLCAQVVDLIPERIAIERFVSQTPAELLVWPRWGLKNYEFTNRLLNLLREKSSKKEK